jgi:hypothetical protein
MRTLFRRQWVIGLALLLLLVTVATFGASNKARGDISEEAAEFLVSKHGGGGFADPRVLFVQQDAVTLFPPDGAGVRVGTVQGAITGGSTTNFQFIPTSPTEFYSDELSLFTDTSGDQILFHVQLTGHFVTPLTGEEDENFPGREDVNLVSGLFSGVYEVVDATGIYLSLMGAKFPAKGLGITPARYPAQGATYMEILRPIVP